MDSLFEQTLVDVWRQVLVENADVVELGTERYPVRRTPNAGLRVFRQSDKIRIPLLPSRAQSHRLAREAELETLEQFGHGLRLHLKGVPSAQTSQRGRIELGDTPQIGKLTEEALETGWRNDL